MKKGNNRISTFSLLVLAVLLGSAGKGLMAQNAFPEQWLRHFREYQVSHFKEKCVLRTDRETYLSGETIWLSARVLDGYTNKPLNISKVVYIELLANGNTPKLQVAIAVQEAMGSGALYLPDQLPSGIYTIRAYTNWMKNDGPGGFFEKPLTIINSTGLPYSDSLPSRPSFQLSLFPESGRPVAGIDNRVGLLLKNRNGHPTAGHGILLNQRGDTILTWHTEKSGMGSFHFIPEYGQRYFARLDADLPGSNEEAFPLAPAQPTGITLQVERHEGQIMADLHSNALQASAPLYFMVHARGRLIFSSSSRMQANGIRFSIPEQKLPEGISRLCIYDQNGQLLAMRPYFRVPQNQETLQINIAPPELKPRDSVSITISGGPEAAGAQLAVSVIRTGQLQPSPYSLMVWIMLQSELERRVDSPEYFFNPEVPVTERQQSADLLMQVQRPLSFGEYDIRGVPDFKPAYLSEYEGMEVSAEVSLNDKPLADATLFLVAPGKSGQLRSGVSDGSGHVHFLMDRYYGGSELLVHARPGTDSNMQVQVASPFLAEYSGRDLPLFDTAVIHDPDLVHRLVDLEIRRRFGQASHRLLMAPADTTAYYGVADITYRLDDYTRFKTLEEVLREYVKEIAVTKINNAYNLSVYNPSINRFYQTNPLVTIDGYPVFDMNWLMNFDPLKIQRIEIVTRPYAIGNVVCNGIVNFITYTGYRPGEEFHSPALPYPGLQWPAIYAPMEQTGTGANPRNPDFRSLLAWQPSLAADESGRAGLTIFCSDVPGRYCIIAEGLSVNGKVISGLKCFEVKQSPHKP